VRFLNARFITGTRHNGAKSTNCSESFESIVIESSEFNVMTLARVFNEATKNMTTVPSSKKAMMMQGNFIVAVPAQLRKGKPFPPETYAT
jgi:hypothetical protein